MPSIQETMDAARNASANVPATQDATGTALATSAPAQQDFGTSFDDFLNGGGLRPDKWLQVKDAGIRIDRDTRDYISEFEGLLDLSTVKFFWGARAEFAGNNVQYAKSYDGKITDKGENFNAVLAEFKANSMKNADPYRGADILITLDAPLMQGKTEIEAGTKVGYSTSITGFAPFQSFIQSMVKQGKARSVNGQIDGEVVRVKVTHRVGVNAKKQEYGILDFALIDG